MFETVAVLVSVTVKLSVTVITWQVLPLRLTSAVYVVISVLVTVFCEPGTRVSVTVTSEDCSFVTVVV